MEVYESEGRGWEEALERIEALRAQEADLEAHLADQQRSGKVQPVDLTYSSGFLRRLLGRFEATMTLGSVHDRRALLGMFLDSVEIWPKEASASPSWTRKVQLNVRLPGGGVLLASPGGFEPPLPA